MKIFLSIIIIFFVITLCTCIFIQIMLSKYNLNKNLLKQNENVITILDENDNEYISEENSNEYTFYNDIPINLVNAFVSIEDKRFFKHNGVDYKGLARAVYKNITTFSYKEGGSTISQQLIKNTHLSSKKNIKRKLIEIKLAKQLEKKFSKEEIMEMYLNTIYFGQNCYGITSASNIYFNKKPENLSLSECASLAGIVKAPSYYSPIKNNEKFNNRKNIVLNEMYNQKYISKKEYENALKEVLHCDEKNNNNFNYSYLVSKELKEINKFSLDNERIIKTNLNINLQKLVEDNLNKLSNDIYKTIIIINKNGICAYSSNIGDCNRQLGSIIKPLGVYAPAIESNYIYPCTPILDEKTNINGYSPSNFGDKYYGYVSAKTALAKGLNIPSVKILNSIGIDYSYSVLEKMNFNLKNEDKNLSLALGSSLYGSSLITIAKAYSVFMNNGIYKDISAIKYNRNNKEIFSKSTTFLTNYMMKESVKNGTLSKLSSLNIPLYGKTGTVGNSNGNTYAYSISYNNSFGVIYWVGNKDKLLDNNYTGGTIPTNISLKIWEYIKDNYENKDFEKNDEIVEQEIDKEEYEQNHNVVLADINAKKIDKITELFYINNLPKETSTKYSFSKIKNYELLVNNNQIIIKLCQTQSIKYLIKKYKNGKIISTKLYDEKYIDTINNKKVYQYEIIPFYEGNDNIIYGKSVLTKKIKLSDKISDSDFWNDDI